MLLSCMYNQKKCNQSDFVWFYSYAYGSCYTFNAKTVNETTNALRVTTENAGSGELDLQFYAQSQLYIGQQEGGSGMIAMIHDNQQMPQIEKLGLMLDPNRKHILQYTKSQISYLGSPYTPCTNEIRPDMSILFQKYGADYKYSQQVCYTLCQQAFIYEQCNCTDANIWNYNNIYVDNKVITAKLCSNPSLCVQNARINFNMNQSIQDQYCSHCLQECAIVKYKVVSSSLTAPTIWNYPVIKQQVEQQFKNVAMPSDWSLNYKTYIDQNYIAVQVIKSTYNVEDYAQQPGKTMDELISALGGQAVLWIGFSLIAIFEILHLVYLLIRRSCAKQQKTSVEPAVEIAVVELNRKPMWRKADLDATDTVDEIVLVK